MATQKLDPVFTAYVVLHFLAILTTCGRIFHRYRRSQLWWDDCWVSIASLMQSLIIVNYLCLGLRSRATFPDAAQVYFTWTSYLLSPTSIWTARISILLSILRMIPPGVNKRVTQVSFGIFIAFLIVVLLSKVFMCGIPVPQKLDCTYPRKTNVLGLSLNLISTIWLICWPIYILVRMKLANKDRNLIIACFASGISLIAFDIAHTINLIKAESEGTIAHYVALNTSGNLQVIFSVVCSNALVLVTLVYRMWRNRQARRREAPSSDTSGDSTTDKTYPDTTRDTNDTRTRETSETTGIYSTIGRLTSINTGEHFATDSSYVMSGDHGEKSDPRAQGPVQVTIADSLVQSSLQSKEGKDLEK